MAMRKTRWSPDTCGCVVEYEWDDAAPPNVRAHALANVVERCPAHVAPAMTDAGIYASVLDENTRKNRVHGVMLAAPEMGETFTDPETGETRRRFRPGVRWQWSFDASRELSIEVTGASVPLARRQQIQAEIDAAVGPGKARLR